MASETPEICASSLRCFSCNVAGLIYVECLAMHHIPMDPCVAGIGIGIAGAVEVLAAAGLALPHDLLLYRAPTHPAINLSPYSKGFPFASPVSGPKLSSMNSIRAIESPLARIQLVCIGIVINEHL